MKIPRPGEGNKRAALECKISRDVKLSRRDDAEGAASDARTVNVNQPADTRVFPSSRF